MYDLHDDLKQYKHQGISKVLPHLSSDTLHEDRRSYTDLSCKGAEGPVYLAHQPLFEVPCRISRGFDGRSLVEPGTHPGAKIADPASPMPLQRDP